MGDLENDPGRAKVVKIVAQLRIDEGDALRHAIGRGLVVVEDDEVDAFLLQQPRFLARVRAAVGGNEEIGKTTPEAVLNALHAESITFFEPSREKGPRLEPVGAEHRTEQCQRTDPVDIVVTVDHDGFTAIDRGEDAFYRGIDSGQGEGITQILESRVEKPLDLLELGLPALQRQRDHDGGKPEVDGIFTDEIGIGGRGDHPFRFR